MTSGQAAASHWRERTIPLISDTPNAGVTMTTAELTQRTSSSDPPPNFVVEPKSLQEHVLGTYLNLRYGIAAFGFALPIILAVVGRILGIPLQGSISAYYYATATDPCSATPTVWPAGTLRTEFVGILIAVGAFLYLYKGFSRSENFALNLAGIFAVGVALVPTTWPPCGQPEPITVHGALAVLFFLSIAYVCLFRARDTLSLVDDPARREKYGRWYKTLGMLMVISPLAATIVTDLFPDSDGRSHRVFFIEAFGVWTFATYWLVKSLELRETSAEQRAITGALARAKRHRRVLPDEAALIER
jgi:hypothetical protein